MVKESRTPSMSAALLAVAALFVSLSGCVAPLTVGRQGGTSGLTLKFVVSGSAAAGTGRAGSSRLLLPTAATLKVTLTPEDSATAVVRTASVALSPGQLVAPVVFDALILGKYTVTAEARDSSGTVVSTQSSALSFASESGTAATLNLVPADSAAVSTTSEDALFCTSSPNSSKTWKVPANSALFAGSSFSLPGCGAGSGVSVYLQALDGSLLAQSSASTVLSLSGVNLDQETYLTLYNDGTVTTPQSVAVYSGRYYAFVANSNGTNSVNSYSYNPISGTLTLIGSYGGVNNPYALAATPSGAFLYAVNYGDASITAFAINADGTLTSIGTYTGLTASAIAAAVDPSGSFLYVACLGSPNGAVWAYKIAADGTLSPIGNYQLDQGTISVRVDPTGRFVYAANSYQYNVRALSINPTTGALASIGAYSASPGTNAPYYPYPVSVAVDPAGRFAYSVHGPKNASATGGIYVFPIDSATGALGTAAIADEAGSLNSIAIHPNGKFAFITVSGGSGGEVRSYTVNQLTGVLTYVNSVTTPSGINGTKAPAVDLTGRLLYAANSNSNYVCAYSIDQTTGALTLLGSFATAATGSFTFTESVAFVRK